MKVVIFGAKAFALGICRAVQELYPAYPVGCFIVTSLQDNPSRLAGLPVMETERFSREVRNGNETDYHILIGTQEDMHPEIVESLEKNGLFHYTCMDSRREARLMEQYFQKIRMFPSLHSLTAGTAAAKLQVYAATFHKDKVLKQRHDLPEWVCPVQVGAELTENRVANCCDNSGEQISGKNVNYCELTALYWVWKNRLETQNNDYFGLFHYRRVLDIRQKDLSRLAEHDVDVILPYPTLHEPDIREHHARYMKEQDWEAMLQALEELQPDYAAAFPKILSQPYFYNYNLMIAKKQVLEHYCAWMFPILKRTEELSSPKGWERADRYIGYLGENLMTLYFLFHSEDLHTVHTGRLMLT